MEAEGGESAPGGSDQQAPDGSDKHAPGGGSELQVPEARWQLLAQQVQGPRKVRCQDRVGVEPLRSEPDGGVQAVLLAVADGHGSAAHTRSHLGAEYAVEVFLELARRFARSAVDDSVALPRLRAEAQQRMPWNIVRAWEQWCGRHLSRQPLEGRPPLPEGAVPRGADLVPYGTTLLGAVIVPGLLVVWQLGDGEAVLVDQEGTRALLPLAPEQPELGDETDSLCSRHAAELMRVHWSPIVGPARPPGLVLLSSDGLSKSFAEQPGYERFVLELYQRLEEGGQQAVADQLEGWLRQAAEYSGDDTTLAAAWYDRGCPGQHPQAQSTSDPVVEPVDDSVYQPDAPPERRTADE